MYKTPRIVHFPYYFKMVTGLEQRQVRPALVKISFSVASVQIHLLLFKTVQQFGEVERKFYRVSINLIWLDLVLKIRSRTIALMVGINCLT